MRNRRSFSAYNGRIQ